MARVNAELRCVCQVEVKAVLRWKQANGRARWRHAGEPKRTMSANQETQHIDSLISRSTLTAVGGNKSRGGAYCACNSRSGSGEIAS